MKKRNVWCAGLMAGAMCLAFTGCGNSSAAGSSAAESTGSTGSAPESAQNSSAATAGKTDGLKIGFTANSLDNATVQESLDKLQATCDANGWELTPIDYKSDLSTCITTIENFTTAGCDIVMFQCPDAEGVKDVVQRAQDAGVIVVAYDTTADYFDYYLTQSDEQIGEAIGKMAADYVNKNLDGEAPAVAIGLRSNPILLTREQSFTKAYEENCNGKVVDSIDCGKYLSDWASLGEVINSAHPETKIVLSIADVVNVGMIDTLHSYGYSNKDGGFAMFGCDCIEATKALWAGESGDDIMIQGSVWTGLPDALSEALTRSSNQILTGEKGEAEIQQEIVAVTPDNYQEVFGK